MNLSEEEVKNWMKMTDENGDGVITIDEYEDVIIRSLEEAGFTVERS